MEGLCLEEVEMFLHKEKGCIEFESRIQYIVLLQSW
jgi:hypothetical protein